MINSQALVDLLCSHAATLGHFETVNSHEPKNAPGNGLHAAVWVDSIAPARGQSGLNITSALVVMNVRLYSSMIAEPQDMIDPNLMDAADALIAAYTGDFTLGGLARNIDLLGTASGNRAPLGAQAGYLEQDKKIFRIFTLTVPLIVNDAWEQVA